MRVGLVVPHIFMHREILPHVIFSPGELALRLAEGLEGLGAEVTLFSPGPADTRVRNVTADLTYFERELAGRGDTYMDLLKKHPFTFVTLARQVQSELIAKAFMAANNDEIDVVHIYANEEEIALSFAGLCNKPVVFTHHDPFNFLVKYKSVFPKHASLNWLSMSYAQRRGMPENTRWVGTIYHGLPENEFKYADTPLGDYVAFMGRIIQPKGLHLAIQAIKRYNETASTPLRLKIAGKHYAGHSKDTYWREIIEPQLDDPSIEFVGHVKGTAQKQEFLGNACALVVPSLFEEPFGMVMIEALACGTPVVGLDSGAIPEVIKPGKNGWLVAKTGDDRATSRALAGALARVNEIDRKACRRDFEARFTLARMCQEHLDVYRALQDH